MNKIKKKIIKRSNRNVKDKNSDWKQNRHVEKKADIKGTLIRKKMVSLIEQAKYWKIVKSNNQSNSKYNVK